MGQPFEHLPKEGLKVTANIVFLTLEQVLVIHEGQIERYGGSHGLRDLALLESAVFRPQTTFDGIDLYLSLFDKAAAFLHSLLLNHPFVDGNKRTAIASSLIFLELNRYRLSIGQKKLENFALSVENKKWDVEKISAWLKKYSKKLK